MNGLLRKDAYLAWAYCKFYVLVAVILMFAMLATDSLFYMIYPAVFVETIPTTLMALEERFGWEVYSDVLPVSRSARVHEKYLLTLMITGAFLVLEGIILALQMVLRNRWNLNYFLLVMAVWLAAALMQPSLLMPVLFKLGSARGRAARSAFVGLLCGLLAVVTIRDTQIQWQPSVWGLALVPLGTLAIFDASWWLSVQLYRNREF